MRSMTEGLLQSKKDRKNHKTTPQSAIADSSPCTGEPKQRANPCRGDCRIARFSFLFYLYSFTLYSFTKFSRSAFMTTQKLDRLIAAAPNIGFNFQPSRLMNTPAASGMPITL